MEYKLRFIFELYLIIYIKFNLIYLKYKKYN